MKKQQKQRIIDAIIGTVNADVDYLDAAITVGTRLNIEMEVIAAAIQSNTDFKNAMEKNLRKKKMVKNGTK